MSKLKITAVLPCYNHSQYLQRRIQSILCQTLPVDQIIFLDDASSDGSLEIAKRLLKDAPIEVLFFANDTNSGSAFSQWNLGVKHAKHPFIWIAETDDFCEPSFLEKLCQPIADHDAIIAFSQSRYVDENCADLGSALSYTSYHYPGAFDTSFSIDGLEFNASFMVILNAIPNASAVLFSRDAFMSVGMANTSMQFCGDWDVWIRLCGQGVVAFVSDELNFFRCHPSTTRAKGYVAPVAAESLACRVRCCLGGIKESPPHVSIFRLLRFLLSPARRNWIVALRSVSYQLFWLTRTRYRILRNVPVLSRGVWLAIYLLGIRDRLRYSFYDLLNK